MSLRFFSSHTMSFLDYRCIHSNVDSKFLKAYRIKRYAYMNHRPPTPMAIVCISTLILWLSRYPTDKPRTGTYFTPAWDVK